MKNSIYLISLLFLFSCNNDDDVTDFYSSQNRSEIFFGKWQGIESNNQHIFFEFTANEYIISSNADDPNASIHLWYNDAQKIHYIRKGKGSQNDAKVSVYYMMNNNNDTLKTSFGDNQWSTYVKISD